MKQGIYAQSARPLYPVGYRIQVGLKVFHYCRAATALMSKAGQGDGGRMFDMIPVAVPGYTGDIVVTIGTGARSCAGILIHEYAGGWFNAFDVALPAMLLLRIKDNDAAVGDACTFYLQDPLLRNMPITGTETCDLHRNIYNNVSERRTGGADISYQSAVCVPPLDVTAGYYFWGQTWGPCMGLAADGGGIGAAVDERAVYFQNDGAIGIIGDGTITAINQYAGFMLGTTWDPIGAAAADDLFFMLQLAP